jgi:hypothetical protein
MKELPSKIPQYKVSFWETSAILLGAIALTGIGLTGLGMKYLRNAATPQRAEAIAKNIMKYSLPEGSQSLLGLNIAGAKVALIASETEEPEIQLLVARIPVDQEAKRRQIERFLDGIALGADEKEFKVSETQTENRQLCGADIPVTVRTGQLKIPGSESKPAVTYQAKVSWGDSRYVVNLLTSGDKSEQTATTVFNSLQCQP